MNNELPLTVRIMADAARYAAGLGVGIRETAKFSAAVRKELTSVKEMFGGLHGQILTLTGGLTALKVGMDSAGLDKSLTNIKLTAGATYTEMEQLRRDLFAMGSDTGRGVDDLKQGFNNLVQMGQGWKEARQEIEATNIAMAVSGANADKLTGALGVASATFNFDLSKEGNALELLDQMTVAGRKGNAELENLSDIFARVGPSAASAGMGFTKTLAFIEALSMVERQPERLATLADSTLRLFNNLHYAKDAAKATKVKFFNADGSRRDTVAVLEDLRVRFQKLKTDKERALWLQKAFGKADLDTIKGLKILLSGQSLANVKDFDNSIRNASGTLKRELPEAISNAVDQTGRLKASLREAADGFARPINDTLQMSIRWAMDKKKNGGLELDGKDMLLGGVGVVAGTALTARYGGKLIGGIAGKLGGTAAGVATGKALQEAAGVTPVYVVNMPSGGLPGGAVPPAPGLPGGAAGGAAAGAAGVVSWRAGAALAMGLPLKEFLSLGASAWATAAAGVLASAAAGYGVGTGASKLSEGTRAGDWIVDKIGGGIAHVLALFGNVEAKTAIETNRRIQELRGGGPAAESPTVKTAREISEGEKHPSPFPASSYAQTAKAAQEAKQAAKAAQSRQDSDADVTNRLNKVLQRYGEEDAKRAIALSEKIKQADLGGTVKIQVETAPGTTATVQATPASSRMKFQVGRTMQGPN
ncbi:phage tail tape measure protein [Chromobacterium piscinae]|uniref:phage tail tape measure protein n=1 Tax=Chromobacterium piscinae TaxID=686831 RepID=UPI001E4B0286|nr:phage tail tape measure protein [Chromobacterium piscinae]MCD5329619.1 phage tail tape measure protein [Chromobacterium piscinae]